MQVLKLKRRFLTEEEVDRYWHNGPIHRDCNRNLCVKLGQPPKMGPEPEVDPRLRMTEKGQVSCPDAAELAAWTAWFAPVMEAWRNQELSSAAAERAGATVETLFGMVTPCWNYSRDSRSAEGYFLIVPNEAFRRAIGDPSGTCPAYVCSHLVVSGAQSGGERVQVVPVDELGRRGYQVYSHELSDYMLGRPSRHDDSNELDEFIAKYA